MTKKRWDLILGLIAIVSLVVAGVLGVIRETGDYEKEISSILPEGMLAQPIDEGRFRVLSEDSVLPKGFIAIETADSYGGAMVLAVLVDTLGRVKDLEILRHKETPSFLQKVLKKGLLENLEDSHFTSSFAPEDGIDVVTGATYTSEAIIECAKLGSRHIADHELGMEVPVEEAPGFSIGIPEITLILLYVVALLGVYTSFKNKKLLRWLTMLTSLIILGFWFSVPLTLSRINVFLLGYWPDWHNMLFWYILVIGFFLVLIITRKNIYCTWICPLGCIQDGLGLVGNARPRFSVKVNRITRWIQRGVAWMAILLALYFRTPVKVNYEIFGVSLSLTGATYLFIMTGIFFIASLFIKRPWCNYLCPITPVADLMQTLTRRNKSMSSGGVGGD